MVYVVFNPTSRHRICNAFPEFNLAGCKLHYVNIVKLCDDSDIDREVKDSGYQNKYYIENVC